MKWFKGANKKIVKFIQEGLGIPEDGFFGQQTLIETALEFNRIGSIDIDFPIETRMYNGFAIFGEDIELVHSLNKKSVKDYKYAISGTFQHREANETVSIFKSGDNVYRSLGSKVWNGKSESVLYKKDGEFHLRRVDYVKELGDVDWAVGGLGLIHKDYPDYYQPDWEGFTGRFSDVLRHTEHVLLGVTETDQLVGFLYSKCRMKNFLGLAKKLKLKYAISLDGGSIAAINTPTFDYNKYTKQNNLIVFK